MIPVDYRHLTTCELYTELQRISEELARRAPPIPDEIERLGRMIRFTVTAQSSSAVVLGEPKP